MLTGTEIQNDSITYAKLQNVSAGSRLIGKGQGSSGDPEEITLGSGLQMAGTTLSVVSSPGGAGRLAIPFYADAGVNLTLTNQANAEQFLGNSNRNTIIVDLDVYTQARLVCRVITASASVNSPRIYLQDSASSDSGYANSAATGTPNCSLSSTGMKDTGWFDLSTNSKVANRFVRVAQNGGDAAADPALGMVVVYFK